MATRNDRVRRLRSRVVSPAMAPAVSTCPGHMAAGVSHHSPSLVVARMPRRAKSSDPISDRESQLATCSRCHRRHLEEHPRFEDKSIDFDALSCSTCHDVHVPAALEE